MSEICVIIPNHNYGHWLPAACRSVALSSKKPLKVIIVDDASEDRGKAAIECAHQFGFDVHLKHKNLGIVGVLNQTIQFIADTQYADYIAIMSADDAVHPHYYQEACDVMDARPEVGFVYSFFQQFGDIYVTTGVLTPAEWEEEGYGANNEALASAPFRLKLWQDVGGFVEQMHEDWAFWRDAFKAGWKAELIPQIMYWYRRHAGCISYGDPKARMAVNYMQLKQRGAIA